MTRAVQIAVIGKGAEDDELTPLAEEVGRRIAGAGAVLVCGGRTGVMEGAARGAADAGGTVIGIVPSADPAEANQHCTHVIAAATAEARNLAVVASGDAVIAIGGEWGTLSEIAHARQFGRPVVAMRSWTVEPAAPIEGDEPIAVANDPAEAVAIALESVRVRD
jgi:uncharacterized protein (TIGR00725 family)